MPRIARGRPAGARLMFETAGAAPPPPPGSRISVVTPTFRRPGEIPPLLENLARQDQLPLELILVDGATDEDHATEQVVHELAGSAPFRVKYLRHGGGTAIQRNVGIDVVEGDFIAFIDDDIRLEPDFFRIMLDLYAQPGMEDVGGLAGYITNQYVDALTTPRWRLYRRLGMFTTFEPGRYDFESGYPINRYMQPPHDGIRPIDFMGTNCAVWRRQVLDEGLRFSEFFKDYGVLEDAHFALRAGRSWRILECGRARCQHLHAAGGRVDARRLAYKTAVNYRFVFVDIVRDRTWRNEWRFWRVQAFDLGRLVFRGLQTWQRDHWMSVVGKLEGMARAAFVRPEPPAASNPSRDKSSEVQTLVESGTTSHGDR